MQKLSQQYKDATEMYNKAVDDVPSGYTLLGMNVVEGLSNMVMNGLGIFSIEY